MKNKTIFIDMDGVLADLDSAFEAWAGYKPDRHRDRGAFFDKFLPEYSRQDGFFTQDPMPMAIELVTFLLTIQKRDKVNLAILTSAGHFVKPNTIVFDQKKRWIEKNVPEFAYIPFCVTSSGKDKALMAHPHAFLIDDHHKNITEFVSKGGNGFVYKEEEFDNLVNALEIFINL